MKKSSLTLQGQLNGSGAGRWRPWAITVLWASRLMLARLARRLRVKPLHRAERPLPELEFYAEAGAPEGALYLNGEYIGRVPGVTRL